MMRFHEYALAQPASAVDSEAECPLQMLTAKCKLWINSLSSEDSDSQKKTDMDILFGKPDKSGDAGQAEIKGSSTKTEETRSEIRDRTIEMGVLFGKQAKPGESNQYDDDYASDYGDKQTAYTSSPEVVNECRR
jgi:hypothetical protein